MKNPLKTNLLSATTASLHQEEMWSLYNRYYNSDKQAFSKRFDSNDYYAFYRDQDTLIGLSDMEMY